MLLSIFQGRSIILEPSKSASSIEENMHHASLDLEKGRTSASDSVSCATEQRFGIQPIETPKHVNNLSEDVCRASIDSLTANMPPQFLPRQHVVTEQHDHDPQTSQLCRASIEIATNNTEHRDSDANHIARHHVAFSHGPSSAGSAASLLNLTELENTTWAFRHHKENILKPIHVQKTSVPRSWFTWGRSRKGQNERDNGKWVRPNEDRDFRISLAELQRMRLRKLQCKLVRHVGYMRKFDKEPPNWESDLETYSRVTTLPHVVGTDTDTPLMVLAKAFQDYDYMMTRCTLPGDPFLVTGERNIDAFVIHNNISDDVLKKSENSTSIPVAGPWETDTQPIGGTRNSTVAKGHRRQLEERIVIAVIAGSFLVAPMWLMVLHNTLYTCLVSTTVFVTVFGLTLAWFLDSPKEVMSGTAAYAAVLVVFVGLGHT